MANETITAKKANPVSAVFKSFFKFCKKNPSFTIGFVIFALLFITAMCANFVCPNDPYLNNPRIMFMKPFVDPQYPLGTDNLGRCLLSRYIYGLRLSLLICFCSVTISVAFGITMGIISGMNYPGPIDMVCMRLVDIQMGFPFIALVIILVSLLGCSIPSLIGVLALSYWAGYARNVRGGVMIEKNMDYVSAARLMGASNGRIATKYLARNILPGILPTVPMDLSASIITESLLSYMGLGVQPPQISLGNVMGDGKLYIATHWWITGMGGFFLIIMGISLTLIGEALHKYFNHE